MTELAWRCTHECGQYRLLLRLHCSSLTRRGGSPPPASLALIPDRQVAGLGVSTGRGGVGSHTGRIAHTPRAMADHGCDGPGPSTTVRIRARVWRSGNSRQRWEAPSTPVTREKLATTSTPGRPRSDRCHRVFGQFPSAPLHPSNRWRTDPEHPTLTLDNTTAISSMTAPVPPGVVMEVIIEMPSERGEKDSSA